jgi:hypothetical protein
MKALSFELAAAEACTTPVAPTFAVVTRALDRRRFVAEQRQLSGQYPLRRHDRASLIRQGRALLRHSYFQVGDIASIEYYRLCDHAGLLRAERAGVHVLQHPGAQTIPLKPSQNPRVDAEGMGMVSPLDPALGESIRASIYPTTPEERHEHPISEVLTFPRFQGFMALRGIETVIDAQELY